MIEPPHPPGRRRRSSRPGVRLVAVVIALALTASQALAQESDPHELSDQLEQTEQQLEDARTQQGSLRQEVGTAQDQLAEADRRLVALTAQLREREAELAEATARHEEAAQRAAEAQSTLDEVTARLEATMAQLEADRDRFGSRVAAAYMYGGQLQMAEALLESNDFSELVSTGYYVESVLKDDKALVDRVTDLAKDVTAQRREADLLRDRQATEEAAAERARAEVQRATDVQADLTRRVGEERDRRQDLVQRLESDLSTYTQLVEDYEAESARLQEELAKSRWQAAAPGPGGLLWPTTGRAGSGFGYRTHPISGSRRMHSGVDIAGPTGQPIITAADGLVVSSGWRGGYGMAVVIDHGGGLATLYAHQSRLLVSEGTVVEAGQQIGEIGSTGYSTGPHLHYEVRVDGVPKDPMEWY